MDDIERPEGKVACLSTMLDAGISSFQKRREKNRNLAFKLKIVGTSLSALTTILLGLQLAEPFSGIFKNGALCFSAFVTVIATWDSFFDHRGLWVRYTATRNQLLAVRAELAYLTSDGSKPPTDSELDLLFRRYQLIMDETNSAWLQGRTDKAAKSS